MIDDDWKKSVDKDVRGCIDARARLEEHDKQQQKELDTDRVEILDLYEHKNRIDRELDGKVGRKAFDSLSKCVNTLKTEKKFLPWLGVIISVIIGLCMIFSFLTTKPAKGGECQTGLLTKVRTLRPLSGDVGANGIRPLSVGWIKQSESTKPCPYTTNDRADTVRSLIKVINEHPVTRRLGFRFDCKDPDSDRPILNMCTLRSREECLAKQPQLEFLARAISITWDRVTGNKTVYVYDNNNLLVYMIDNKGKFIAIDNNLM